VTAHILIVDDEPKIADVLRKYLQAEGYSASVLHSGEKALETIRSLRPDAVLLDVMLPGQDGIAVLRELRTVSNVPVLLVTARVEEIDRLVGLEFGADDYICKPFSPREVVARVKAVLRRAGKDAEAAAPAPLEFDEPRFLVRVTGREMVVTPVEFRLLQAFAAQPGRVFSRAQLASAIYPDHRVVSDRTMDSHIKNVRKKLAELGADPIDSVYGVGYRWDWKATDS
jgi:two-component system response regulator BaeR